MKILMYLAEAFHKGLIYGRRYIRIRNQRKKVTQSEQESSYQIKNKSEQESSYQIKNKSSQTQCLPITGLSDLSRVKIRVPRTPFTSLNIYSEYNFTITQSDDEAHMNDDRVAVNFAEFGQEFSPEYCKFDFFVKQNKLDNLKLDFKMTNVESILQLVFTIMENRSVSLHSLQETKKVPFTSFPDIEGVQVEIEVSQQKDVKFGTDLCEREKQFVEKRKIVVNDNIRNKLGLKLPDDKYTPTIAIIGSGGGMRAVIGMCGAMTALKDNGILDSTMYKAGVSGSAWYLLALFVNDKEKNPKDLNDGIRDRLQTFKSVYYWQAWNFWRDVKKRLKRLPISPIHYTFTNTFGNMIGFLLNEEKHNQKVNYWSNHADKLIDGSVPLPLVAAIQVHDDKTVREEYYKARKKNQNKGSKEDPQTTIEKDQDETVKKYHEWLEFSPFEVFIPQYGAAIDMNKFGDKMYGGYGIEEHGEACIEYLQGICGSAFTFARYKKPSDRKWYMSWRDIKVWVVSLFKTIDDDFVAKVPNILRGITDLQQIENEIDPSTAITDVNMMLIDAGIDFNSPYPTILRPSRKVDIILSFDFSDRLDDSIFPFEQLVKAEQWAKSKCCPFPDISSELNKIKKQWEDGNHEEVYVFQSDNAPTIIHFVLINKSFRYSGETGCDFDIFPDFDTLRFQYSEHDFNKLNRLVQHNVHANNDKILKCIQEVIDRKQKET